MWFIFQVNMVNGLGGNFIPPGPISHPNLFYCYLRICFNCEFFYSKRIWWYGFIWHLPTSHNWVDVRFRELLVFFSPPYLCWQASTPRVICWPWRPYSWPKILHKYLFGLRTKSSLSCVHTCDTYSRDYQQSKMGDRDKATNQLHGFKESQTVTQ